MVSALDVLSAAGIRTSQLRDGVAAGIGDYSLILRYTATEVLEATVDGQSCMSALVSDGTLYVSVDLFASAGATYDLRTDLSISFKVLLGR